MANEQGLQGRSQVYGHRDGEAQPIDSIDDGGTERLAVSASIDTVAEINLDETNDEVAVYGGVNGSETPDAATRQIINVDSAGRVRTDSTLQVADADVSNGNPVPVSDAGGSLTVDGTVTVQDGGGTLTVDQATHDNLNANANIQVNNADVSTSNAVPVQGTAAAGAASSGNPVLTAGAQAAGTVRAILVDSAGHPLVSGAAAHGAAIDGNPVRVGGRDGGGLTRDIMTDTSGVLAVQDNGGSLSVDDNGGSLTVDGTVTANAGSGTFTVGQSTASNLNAQVVGNIAHDGVDSGNPILQGLHAIDHGSSPTAVAAADRTRWVANRHGIPFVMGGHPNVQTRAYRAGTAARTDVALITVGSGTKIVLTSIAVTLDEATTVGVACRIGFGTANTPAEPAANSTTDKIVIYNQGLVPGGGITRGDGSGIIGIGADNEDLRLTCEAPTSGDLSVVYSWYEVPA